MRHLRNLLTDHVVELEDYGVGFAAIHAWMLEQKISDECPIAPEVAQLVDLASFDMKLSVAPIVRLAVFALAQRAVRPGSAATAPA